MHVYICMYISKRSHKCVTPNVEKRRLPQHMYMHTGIHVLQTDYQPVKL